MSRPRRFLLTGGVLTVLLALVAVASRGHRPGGGGGGEGGHVPLLLGEYLGVMMLVLMLIVTVLTGYGLASDRRRKALAGRTNWRRMLTGMLTVLVALAVGLLFTRNLTQRTTPVVQPPAGIGGQPLGTTVQRGQTSEPRQPRRESADVRWLTALLLGSLLVGAAVAAAFAVRHRRTDRDELEAEAALARALDEVLADTLDDLRAEGDPRTAVIHAYARMERTFAAYRVPRVPAEAPLEYVARVLDSLSVSGYAVRRLTLLFERAKFSTHEVDEGMKEEAIETLAAVRAELEAGHEAAAA